MPDTVGIRNVQCDFHMNCEYHLRSCVSSCPVFWANKCENCSVAGASVHFHFQLGYCLDRLKIKNSHC